MSPRGCDGYRYPQKKLLFSGPALCSTQSTFLLGPGPSRERKSERYVPAMDRAYLGFVHPILGLFAREISVHKELVLHCGFRVEIGRISSAEPSLP